MWATLRQYRQEDTVLDLAEHITFINDFILNYLANTK